MVPISVPAYRTQCAVRAKVLAVKLTRIKVVTRYRRPLINSVELVEGRFFSLLKVVRMMKSDIQVASYQRWATVASRVNLGRGVSILVALG